MSNINNSIVEKEFLETIEEFDTNFYKMTNKAETICTIVENSLNDGIEYNDRLLNFFRNYLKLLSMEEVVNIRNYLFQIKETFSKNAELILILGILEKHLGVNNKAIEYFQKAIEVKQNYIEAMIELNFLLIESNKINEVLHNFTVMSQIAPKDWRIWNDAGCVLKSIGKEDEALEWMKKGSKLIKDNATLFANIALLEYEKHNYEQAQQYLDKAFKIEPNFSEALHTQAMVFGSTGKHEDSYKYDLKALKNKADYPQAKLGLALSALTLGDFKEGFAGYEHRWAGSDKKDTNIIPTIKRPQWLGQKVYPFSSLAILSEQGLGDCIQFAQLLPKVLKKFHSVIWSVPNELYKLMKYNFESERLSIVNQNHNIDANKVDYETPILSLALALNLTIEKLDKKESYLNIPKDNRFNQFFKEFNSKNKTLKVGLCYTGSQTLAKQELRSIDPKEFSILDNKNITFFNLQKDKSFPKNVVTNLVDLMPTCVDLFDTASIINELDLVISVDTSVVHLSAALGKKTFLLNRFGSEWRWMDKKEDSPWYPSLKIFNQTALRDWKSVLEKVNKEL